MDVVETWTGRRAGALRGALRMSVDAFAAHLGVAVRTVAHWDAHPDVVPRPAMQEILDATLLKAPESAKERFWLLLKPDRTDPNYAVRDSRNRNPAGSESVLPTQVTDQGELFMAAAHESAHDSILRATQLGTDALPQLHEQIVQIARRYSGRPPIEVFTDARRVRQITAQLIERTRRPSDLADLYVISGEATALMSSITFDLGHWDAAVTLAQAATTDANLSGHASLEAWTIGLQATLANWRDEPASALRHFERGLRVAPPGAARLRMLYIASRSHALRGDAASAAGVLEQARADRDLAEVRPDELQDEIRGEFRFDDARAAACAGAAWLHLRSGEEAERYTLEALSQYEAAPAESRPFSPVGGARIDTSAARLLRGDLDGAVQILGPVLDLEPRRRNAALTGRLRQVRTMLEAPQWQSEPEAVQLVGNVREWMADTAAQPLPPQDAS